MVPRIVIVALALLAAVALRHSGGPAGAAPATATGVPRATAADRAAAVTFDPGVMALNRRAWLDAVARARPEARELFDRVDGLVTVEDAAAPEGAVGVTIPRPDGYTVRFDFGATFRDLGPRGFDRVVDHELAHVVAFALLDDALLGQLDAGIPPGQPCPAGTRIGSCAPKDERFAETFAKWASGDIGVNLYAGYAVPPPPDLEAWGAPLAALAARR